MLSLVARYREKILRFRIPDEEAVLGASPRADLVVPFPGVSRSHARIVRQGGAVKLTDLTSKNGTWLGRDRVTECLLRPGENARVGQVVLSVEDGPTSDMEFRLVPRTVPPPVDNPGDETETPHETGRGGSATLALRFVRTQERSAAGAAISDRKTFLDEAADLLDAAALVVLQAGASDDPVVVEFGLWLPPLEGLREVARLAESDPPSGTRKLRRGLDWAVLAARHGDRVLAALYPAHMQFLDPWQVDFFEYIADKVTPETDHPPRRAGRKGTEAARKPVGEPLVFPAGMVVGRSKAITHLLNQIRATAGSGMDVLLLGETGTGKELFARMVHDSGPKAKGPFVAINCAAIPNELLEAELFGVQARVATGVDARVGLFQQANGGAILLDDVGELAEPLQAKLLRVLQEREILLIGASAPRKLDIQVISTSNRNLTSAIKAGRFRTDLFYRLRALQFHIPPLRERVEDLPDLVLALVERAAKRHRKQILGVSRKALEILAAHDWPGNVRELQSEVERAVLVCSDGAALQSEHFRPIVWLVEHRAKAGPPAGDAGPAATAGAGVGMPGLIAGGEKAGSPDAAGSMNLHKKVDDLEKASIEEALQTSKGNKSLAARLLGITRNGLALKLKRLRITG